MSSTCQGAYHIDRKADTLWAGGAPHMSQVTALPLSASHSLVKPSEV
jgi:hypothetical protein